MSVAIVCDDGEGNSRTDCDVELRGTHGTAREARKAAGDAGWKRRDGQDLCPVCLYGLDVEG